MVVRQIASRRKENSHESHLVKEEARITQLLFACLVMVPAEVYLDWMGEVAGISSLTLTGWVSKFVELLTTAEAHTRFPKVIILGELLIAVVLIVMTLSRIETPIRTY